MPAHFEVVVVWSNYCWWVYGSVYVLLCPFCSLGEVSPVQLLKCTSLPVECCKEAGNVSIAPQGQSPLSHTMEGWAGPEKAEGWITAWSSPLKLPQPSLHRDCCSCRHSVTISHPWTSLCPLQQDFTLPHAGLHPQGRRGSA